MMNKSFASFSLSPNEFTDISNRNTTTVKYETQDELYELFIILPMYLNKCKRSLFKLRQ